MLLKTISREAFEESELESYRSGKARKNTTGGLMNANA
jgi:hypothetical protein